MDRKVSSLFVPAALKWRVAYSRLLGNDTGFCSCSKPAVCHDQKDDHDMNCEQVVWRLFITSCPEYVCALIIVKQNKKHLTCL